MSYYNTAANDNRTNFKFNIWLVNTLGYILIRKDANQYTPIRLNNLTLEAASLDDLIRQVEVNWGILCSKEDLKEIYSINTSNEIVWGNILMLNLSWEQKSLIESKYNGVFVNYRELEGMLPELQEDYKEALYYLIAELDNVHGHHNVQFMLNGI